VAKRGSGAGRGTYGQRELPPSPVFLWENRPLWISWGKLPRFFFVFLCMRWLTADQVREVFREVLGWDVHPNTLRAWSRTGKLQSVISPGRGRTFYPIEAVAGALGLEPSQVEAIVQKEKGGRP
jgi:hypothetical protein